MNNKKANALLVCKWNKSMKYESHLQLDSTPRHMLAFHATDEFDVREAGLLFLITTAKILLIWFFLW